MEQITNAEMENHQCPNQTLKIKRTKKSDQIPNGLKEMYMD